jgi:hypothetical protein
MSSSKRAKERERERWTQERGFGFGACFLSALGVSHHLREVAPFQPVYTTCVAQ